MQPTRLSYRCPRANARLACGANAPHASAAPLRSCFVRDGCPEARHGGTEVPNVPKVLVSYPPVEQSYLGQSRSHLGSFDCGAEAPGDFQLHSPDFACFSEPCIVLGDQGKALFQFQRHSPGNISTPCIALGSQGKAPFERHSHSTLLSTTLPKAEARGGQMLGEQYLDRAHVAQMLVEAGAPEEVQASLGRLTAFTPMPAPGPSAADSDAGPGDNVEWYSVDTLATIHAELEEMVTTKIEDSLTTIHAELDMIVATKLEDSLTTMHADISCLRTMLLTKLEEDSFDFVRSIQKSSFGAGGGNNNWANFWE